MKVKTESDVMSFSPVQLLATPGTAAHHRIQQAQYSGQNIAFIDCRAYLVSVWYLICQREKESALFILDSNNFVKTELSNFTGPLQ